MKFGTYVDRAKVASHAVPDGKDDPAPEDAEVEVDMFLAGLVHLRIPVHVLVVHVLLQTVCEEARPGRPECVI